jgi:hypothetical protein
MIQIDQKKKVAEVTKKKKHSINPLIVPRTLAAVRLKEITQA